MFSKEYCKTFGATTQQEELGVAALHAVVAAVGGSCQASAHRVDEAGVDAHCLFYGRYSPRPDARQRVEVDFQLKATARPERVVKREECFVLREYVSRLEKYMTPGNVPLLLALYVMPEDAAFERCVEVDVEKTTLRKCLYWTSLTGFPLDRNKETNTVYFPTRNVLTPEALAFNVVAPLSEKEVLYYAKQE